MGKRENEKPREAITEKLSLPAKEYAGNCIRRKVCKGILVGEIYNYIYIYFRMLTADMLDHRHETNMPMANFIIYLSILANIACRSMDGERI